MIDTRFQEIEALIEDAGRCFDPVTGRFESMDEVDIDMDLDTDTFLSLLGVTQDECAEYVQRKLQEYDDAARNA